MSVRHFGRLARSIAVAGIVTFAAVGLVGPRDASVTPVALAGVAQQNGNDNNDDPTNDNSEERILRGQVLEIWYPGQNDPPGPPQILVGVVGADPGIWARVYNDQIQRTGLNRGDHVRLNGEYQGGVFDAYDVDITDRCCDSPDNANDND